MDECELGGIYGVCAVDDGIFCIDGSELSCRVYCGILFGVFIIHLFNQGIMGYGILLIGLGFYFIVMPKPKRGFRFWDFFLTAIGVLLMVTGFIIGVFIV